MNFKFIFIVIFYVTIYSRSSFCGVVNKGDVSTERDLNFLIKKIEGIMKDENLDVKKDHSKKTDNHVENVIHYDKDGKSIESEKMKLKNKQKTSKSEPSDKDKHKVSTHKEAKAVNPHEEVSKKSEHAESKRVESTQTTIHEDISGSVDEHAIRYDRHGNSLEMYKDSDEEHEEHDEVPQKKKKKKKSKKNNIKADDDGTINLNHVLSDKVVNQQLLDRQKQKLEEDEYYDEEEDDDVPLITIPMVDILRQYNRMQQGFVSETEEYSDEATLDAFDDPHLKEIFDEISAERKIVKQEKKMGMKVKPAAKRVLERHLGSADLDESL